MQCRTSDSIEQPLQLEANFGFLCHYMATVDCHLPLFSTHKDKCMLSACKDIVLSPHPSLVGRTCNDGETILHTAAQQPSQAHPRHLSADIVLGI